MIRRLKVNTKRRRRVRRWFHDSAYFTTSASRGKRVEDNRAAALNRRFGRHLVVTSFYAVDTVNRNGRIYRADA